MSSASADGKIFLGPCTFMRAASAVEHFPPDARSEVAFFGRSNVGKSALLNALTGRKSLARSSKTPGRTQEILFFDLGGKLTLVDLPGYGHANAPRETQDRWNELVQKYLRARPQLRVVTLLIDGRHGALTNDLSAMSFLDRAGISYQVVLTKSDLVKGHDHDARVQQMGALLKQHAEARQSVMSVSSDKNLGIEELRDLLAQFAG